MKTKLLYVLVSSPNDIYLEQAYISMRSAKYHMPNVKISLIMDKLTEDSLYNERKKILDIIDEKVVLDLPEELTGQKRSRILKTSCRNIIDGDFLFIDCDTIILKPLDEIDSFQAELAACRDSHSPFWTNPYRKMCIDHCKKIGCQIEREQEYFNSGVILARDTEKVRSFYREWNRNWQDGVRNGVLMDQPAFAKTNLQFNHLISLLSDFWNCQVIHCIKYINNAKILHYLCTSPTKLGDRQMFLLRDKSLLLQLKERMDIPAEISNCFENPTEGLADCVHVLAGNNIQICQSDIFKFAERNYGSSTFYFWNKIFRGFNLFYKLRQRLITKVR